MATKTLAGELARLGGGDPGILDRVPSARSGFLQMGLVLLSTAGLAVISMTFALVDGLKVPVVPAVAAGLGWGFVILNLDRLLIKSMHPGQGFWRAIMMVLPRLAMAGLLGLVIATPLVLRVFQDEIRADMQQQNAQADVVMAGTRANGPAAQRLEEVEERIAADEAILAGELPGATSPNVQAAEERLAAAEDDLAEKREIANDAYDEWRCELDGQRCSGGSGRAGNGDRARRLQGLYDIAAADLAQAQEAADRARDALDAANAEAATNATTSLDAAQDRAAAELPALIAERDALQSQVSAVAADDHDIQADNTGMLAQIEALERIGEESPAAGRAHMAVAGLFFMIELLPVIVKFLTSLGQPSLHDRIRTLNDDSAYDDAVQQRNIDRRRIETDSKKRREIEEHMRSLEVRLGKRANTHVAGEMERILDVALKEWSDEVTSTLHTTGPGPGPGSANGGPAAPGAAAGSGGPTGTSGSAGTGHPHGGHSTHDGAIRSAFGLPSGGRL